MHEATIAECMIGGSFVDVISNHYNTKHGIKSSSNNQYENKLYDSNGSPFAPCSENCESKNQREFQIII